MGTSNQQNIEFIIPIDTLATAAQGTNEEYSIDSNIEIEIEKNKYKLPINGKVVLMRIDKGIHVTLEKLNTSMDLECDRCLKIFKKEISIPTSDRIFYFKKESIDDSDINDIFLVNSKKMEIDLYEMFRQEIILHFPLIKVCSDSCKGICPICGKDLNQSKCTCEKSTANPQNNKLSILKKLVQD